MLRSSTLMSTEDCFIPHRVLTRSYPFLHKSDTTNSFQSFPIISYMLKLTLTPNTTIIKYPAFHLQSYSLLQQVQTQNFHLTVWIPEIIFLMYKIQIY